MDDRTTRQMVNLGVNGIQRGDGVKVRLRGRRHGKSRFVSI